MRFTTGGGVDLDYEKRKGKAPTLVLLHGWTNNRTVWTKIVNHISYETIALDLRGHGKSDKPADEEDYEIELFNQDIIELLNHEKIEHCVLIGHSMGGMIALTTEDPRIDALVLINTSAGIKDRLPIGPGPFLARIGRFFEEHQTLIPKDLSDPYRNDFDTFLRGLAGTSPVATIKTFEEMYDLDVSERLEQINVPTLVIAGKDDHVLPKRFSRILGKIPNSRLETIDSNHFSLIDHAEEIVQLIEEFVESTRV